MLTSKMLFDLAKEKLEQSRYAKNKTFLQNQSKAFKDYAHLVNTGFNEAYFQKELTRVKTDINQRLETFTKFKDLNTEDAKDYHKRSGLIELEFTQTNLYILLERGSL